MKYVDSLTKRLKAITPPILEFVFETNTPSNDPHPIPPDLFHHDVKNLRGDASSCLLISLLTARKQTQEVKVEGYKNSMSNNNIVT